MSDRQRVIEAQLKAVRESRQAYEFSPGSYTATAMAAVGAAHDAASSYLHAPEDIPAIDEALKGAQLLDEADVAGPMIALNADARRGVLKALNDAGFRVMRK